MDFSVRQISENRGLICKEVLKDLPEWFGIEKAINHYVIETEKLPTFVAELDGRLTGFVSLKIHYEKAAEVYVMGVKKEFHRRGIGKLLMNASEEYLREKGVEFLQVKTLSDSHTDKNYALTRDFYKKCGFVPLEEIKTLWDESNPCLIMVKAIKRK